MTEIKTYQALAKAFVDEGTTAHFTLLGDGNMHFGTSMARDFGIETIHARHEHCAISMAMGYARTTGEVGVSSVTLGPGFTQITTALTAAVRSRTPLVILVGDKASYELWNIQDFAQAPMVQACGAHHIEIRSLESAHDAVRNAFYVARYERRPVVLTVPADLIMKPFPQTRAYVPSHVAVPQLDPVLPHPHAIEQAAVAIRQARKPIIIAGRGAISDEAAHQTRRVAQQSGALLATTLLANGLFDGDPYSIGIAGGFSNEIARELFAESDLVIAVGASLSHHTMDGGKLFPNARVIQIDTSPQGISQGLKAADLHVQADSAIALAALADRLESDGAKLTGLRTDEMKKRIIEGTPDNAEYPVPPLTVDPRKAVAEINQVIPKDWNIVGGSGHSFFFSVAYLRGREPKHYLAIREFGAIGSSLSYAIGVATARKDGGVVLFDGDGGTLMHVQELETIRRHGLRLLIVVLNDGAYGTEVHKLNAEGVDPGECIFGRADFAAIAKGFGLHGETVAEDGKFASLFDKYGEHGTAEVWDINVAETVVAPYRRPERLKAH